MSAVLLALVLIGTLAMPFLVWAMASGFVGDARFDLAVSMAASPLSISSSSRFSRCCRGC
jgi:hypothetical protein